MNFMYISRLLIFHTPGIVDVIKYPEANERGSSLIGIRLHYRVLQRLFLTKRKKLWLRANGRFRMRNGMAQGIVVMREWKI